VLSHVIHHKRNVRRVHFLRNVRHEAIALPPVPKPHYKPRLHTHVSRAKRTGARTEAWWPPHTCGSVSLALSFSQELNATPFCPLLCGLARVIHRTLTAGHQRARRTPVSGSGARRGRLSGDAQDPAGLPRYLTVGPSCTCTHSSHRPKARYLTIDLAQP
jgi:hypothetical protein